MGFHIVLAVFLIRLSCKYTEAQQAFLSIDCGGCKNFTDANVISWFSDNSISGIAGNASKVTPPAYVGNSPSPLSCIRFFPGGQSKYCYMFDLNHYGLTQGKAFLIRASFWAGSHLPYPTRFKNSVSFKFVINADEWEEVSIEFPQTGKEVNKEMYLITSRDNIEVCLSGSSNDSDIPFISSLVLRELADDLLPISLTISLSAGRPLTTVKRTNFGVYTEAFVGAGDISEQK
ncbi:hypothetical protein KP509_1Z186200 [Ceratopteris richardii]|nr:hypothetical protein KP509_1Z186200 [Ceratopteris richardii]